MIWPDALAQRTVVVIAIITPIITILAFYIRNRKIRERVAKLKQLLSAKTKPGDDSLTVEQLSAAVGCTVEQVIEAASRSKEMESWIGQLGNEHRYRLKRL